MNPFLTTGRSGTASALIVVLAVAAGAHTARADYLVRTYADSAPAYVRSPLREENVPPQFAWREPLTVDQPHEDSEAPKAPEMEEAELAAALQALLVCAIPPPVDTIMQTPTTPTPATTTTTTTTPQQPSVPAPPEFILPTYPEGSTSTGTHTADAPEPASLITALVGSGLTGLVLLRRRGKKKRQLLAA
jgi:hypothetical protein